MLMTNISEGKHIILKIAISSVEAKILMNIADLEQGEEIPFH